MQSELRAREFDRALAAMRAGDAASACKICRAALAPTDDDPDLLTLLGASLNVLRDADSALVPLERALALAPGFARALEERGRSLLLLRRGAEAIEALRTACAAAPKSASARRLLARALARSGQGSEADTLIEAEFARDPLQGALLEAAEHQRAGRYRESEPLLRDVLRQRPEDVNGLRMLARVAEEAGRHGEAERLLRHALQHRPNFDDARLDLARVLKQRDRLDDAIAVTQETITRSPRNPLAQNLHAGMLALRGEHVQAIDTYRRSIALHADNPAAWVGLGHQLKTLGRTDEAVAAYREAIRLRPVFGEVYWSLANLKTFRFDTEEIEAMERALADDSIEVDSRVHFLFALGKSCEDAARHAEAFRFYEQANALQRRRVAYDPVETEFLHDRIRSTFSADFITARERPLDPNAAIPIFIVGLPRSGSTLVEQILASHRLVDGTAELPDIARLATDLARRMPGERYPEAVAHLDAPALREIGEEYLERTRGQRSGRPFFTDKMPNNFAAVGFIHLMLPQARIIDVRRHPLDSCLGCYKQHFAFGQSFTYDLVELGEFYLEYRRMMRHWEAVLPGRVLEFRHEDLVLDQERQTRRLLDWCGLPWEDACLNFHETDRAVRTASSEQVRRPLYAGALDHWRHFRAQLAPLVEIIGADVEREGWAL